MRLSIRYYVLCLHENTNRLYEAFRNQLIDIQNTEFPYSRSIYGGSADRPYSHETQSRDFARRTDERFGRYYGQDPLGLMVLGKRDDLSLYMSLTVHRPVIIATIEGDYSNTSLGDLGMIVWPVVKQAMARTKEKALRVLEDAEAEKRVVSGIEAVGQCLEAAKGSPLFVEEDYHVKGSIQNADGILEITGDVGLLDVLSDVVDIVIDKVLETGGSVVFLESGSLLERQRIAMILPG